MADKPQKKELNELQKKVDKNTKITEKNTNSIYSLEDKFDEFLSNHFKSLVKDVSWLKKLQWWQFGMIASVFCGIVLAILVTIIKNLLS